MKKYLIIYDLRGKDSNDYRRLIDKIEELGGNKVQYSSWYLITDIDINSVRKMLSEYVDDNDSLIITEVRSEILSKMSRVERLSCIICEKRYYIQNR